MKIELNKVYRDRLKREWKIVVKYETYDHTTGKTRVRCIYINKEQNDYGPCDENGKSWGMEHLENYEDLIELVGDDFTTQEFDE